MLETWTWWEPNHHETILGSIELAKIYKIQPLDSQQTRQAAGKWQGSPTFDYGNGDCPCSLLLCKGGGGPSTVGLFITTGLAEFKKKLRASSC